MENYQPGLIGSLALAAIFLYGLAELLWLTVLRKKVAFRHEYSQVTKNLVIVITISVVLPLSTTMGLAVLGKQLTLFSLGNSWYIWPIAFLIYEFWYWVQHFLAHKVRLLWCLHSPHHAPDTINMIVGYNHHMLEIPYMSFFLGFIPALCGVPLEMILFISLVDMCWGSLLHVSPRVISRQYGLLESFLQTPSYHRVHHAKNPRYMDTNYNSMTLFWDWAMSTRQVLRDDEPVVFGITREVDVRSWPDVQFGEFKLLWSDLKRAPGFATKLRYLLMPPGWSHTGHHQMASTQKAALTHHIEKGVSL